VWSDHSYPYQRQFQSWVCWDYISV